MLLPKLTLCAKHQRAFLSSMSKKAKIESEVPKCECGCDDATNGGRFLPGHDAKLKSKLIKDALAGGEGAVKRLEALGWTKFLDAKRSLVAQKAAKKAGKASVVAEGSQEEPEALQLESNVPLEVIKTPKRRGRPPKARAENMSTDPE